MPKINASSFSTLEEQIAPEKKRKKERKKERKKDKGTALTILNCIGFSFTLLSIQLISTLF
jgi:hypothetical protein